MYKFLAIEKNALNEKAITVAISLLKLKNTENIKMLKNLLTFIPKPNHVKDVLVTAVIKLIDTNPQSAFWLFQYPELLEPEIQVRDILAKKLTRKIISWGHTVEDFYFTENYTLLLSHRQLPDDEAFCSLILSLLKVQ